MMITLSQLAKKAFTQYADKIAVADKYKELSYKELKNIPVN